MSTFASGQTRRLSAGSRRFRVRAATLGLFVFSAVFATPGCAKDPHAAAAEYDRRYETGLFTWLADHAPSTVVAWHVESALVRDVDPNARVILAGAHPCTQAARGRAALVVLFERTSSRRLRDAALDCGFALFGDRGGAAIAPR